MILVCIHLSVNVFIVSTCCCFLMTKLNLVVARARICYFLFCTKMEVQKKPKLSTKHMAVLLLFAKGWQWVVPYMMNMCLLLILGLDILWVYSTLDVYNNIMVLYWIFVDFQVSLITQEFIHYCQTYITLCCRPVLFLLVFLLFNIFMGGEEFWFQNSCMFENL